MNKEVILNCKAYINEDLEQEFKQYILYVINNQESNTEYKLAYEYIFQQVYIHACLKKKRDIAEWLQTTLFPRLDPIQQIGLRQVFPYGRYLLAK